MTDQTLSASANPRPEREAERQLRGDIQWLRGAAKYLLFFSIILSVAVTGDNAMALQNSNSATVEAVKLTYLGIQDKPVPSIVFSSDEIENPIELFQKYGSLHSNDEFGINVILVSAAILNNIVEISEKYDSDRNTSSDQAEIALSILDSGKCRSTSYLLDPGEATEFFNQLHQELMDLQDEALQFDAWRARTNL